MYHSIYILISVIAAAFCSTNGTSTNGTDPDLLAAIREDLRRNNDDYVESTIAGRTFASPKSTPPTSKVFAPISNSSILNTSAKNQPPSLFRRNLGTTPSRGLILPIVTKPKHKHIKGKTPQHIPNLRVNIEFKKSKTEVETQTPPTRTSKKTAVSRRNDLEMPVKRKLKLKLRTTVVERDTSSVEEAKKINDFMKIFEKKKAMKTKETTPTSQAKPRHLSTPEYGPRMVLTHDEAPMVMPVRDKPSMMMSTQGEMAQIASAQWDSRVASAKKDLPPPLPTWRAAKSVEVTSGDTLIPINEHQLVTTLKAGYDVKNPARMGIKGMDDVNILQSRQADLKMEKLKAHLKKGLRLSSLPPGHLLDMWPARGPRVHAMRSKDRLCQRSMLLNEGPKYDSRGKIYLPGFKPYVAGSKYKIDFHQTKKPRLLLPRCCNCCRKSVLGCE